MGRKPHNKDQKRKSRTFRLTDSEYILLKNLGDGKAQAGFDMSLRYLEKVVERLEIHTLFK